MSYNNFFVPDSGYSATATEDLDEALRESGIPRSDLANALPTRRQARRLAPPPSSGVTKARQAAPAGRKARQRADDKGQPLKRISEACLSCRRAKVKCDGEKPSCGRCILRDLLCGYGYTEKEDAAQREAAAYARLRGEAFEVAASAPQYRYLQPRSEGPVTALGELAAAPVLSPPLPEQTMQSQIQPVQSIADLVGSNQYTPTQFTPASHSPTNYTPTDYTSTSYPPTVYTPSSYNPTYHTPTHVNPTHLYSAQIGQNQFGETLGDWNPRPNYSSQYPGLESLLDEQFQHPQESRFAQRGFSQLPSGPLQCHEGFGFTDDAPAIQPGGIQFREGFGFTDDAPAIQPGGIQFREGFGFTDDAPFVQPDWNAPDVNHQDTVRPSVPVWSDTGVPARSVPWSEPVFNDFGLGSMDNAQTPAGSSHYAERARSPAYIAAMMPPREDRWA